MAPSRWESPVGALRALIGSWDAARAPEAVAPAERDAERDADRDPERDAEPGVVLGVVLVPRPPARRLGVSPAVGPPTRPLVLRPGVLSPAVRAVVLRWGAGCAGPAGVWGPAGGPAWGPGRPGLPGWFCWAGLPG